MEFIPLYCKENLTLINPYGTVGVITLWSRKEYVHKKFHDLGIDLNPDTSPIAAFGNLYGNGLKYLLANLLYNPQIRYLLISGWNRSDSLKELQHFFHQGVQEHTYLGVVRNKIVGTERYLDTCLKPELFHSPPHIIHFGDINEKDTELRTGDFLKNVTEDKSVQFKRLKIELPQIKVHYFPSNPRAHQIVKDSPLAAWKELVFCLHRFGHHVNLGPKKGERVELQNVKVVIENPHEEQPESLQQYGFSPENFKAYQKAIVKGELREGEEAYNYGSRIRSYFGIDGIEECIKKLKNNEQDRRSFIGLWDSRTDLTFLDQNAPCLVSIFFRVFDEKLTLTATFRVHNAVTAWLENFYGLMEIQKVVSEGAGIPPGAITVISLSISINMDEYDRAYVVVKEKEKQLEFEADPHGQFRITLEEGQIIVRHIFGGEVINEYRSTKAERIQYELKRDHALSDIAHAIYIGRQLAKAERCLLTGEEFEED